MNQSKHAHTSSSKELDFHIRHHEIVIASRYEFLYTINDILIALWFIIGSFMFFNENTTYMGTWFFVVGSFELLIRPMIQIIKEFHLRKISPHSSKQETLNSLTEAHHRIDMLEKELMTIKKRIK